MRSRFLSQRHPVFLGLLVLSIAAAAIALPLIWKVLQQLTEIAPIDGLRQLLAQSPIASWVLMLVLGTLVPVSLGRALAGGAHRIGLMVLSIALALLWYAHMPAVQQCQALYANSSGCNILQWLHSLSLSIATSMYLFCVFVGVLSGLGLMLCGNRPDTPVSP